MSLGIIVLLLGITAVVMSIRNKNRRVKQLAYIQNYHFPLSLNRKIIAQYPHLTNQQVALVLQALKQYFQICLLANKRMVAMPSQVVDVAWHEFILFTRLYQLFCHKAIGRFLHHTPTEAMVAPTLAQQGIKRAWRLCCAQEQITPSHPVKLPLLFAIDDVLKIENGFKYTLDCQDRSSPLYGEEFCAGHIGCSSGCHGDSGATDTPFSSDGGSDCGGSDCGGGCGGD